MLKARQLPQPEWDKLKGTELEAVYPHADPTRTTILVVEDNGVVVGCWGFFEILHAEGLWTAPNFRGKGVVARHLLRAFYRLVQERKVKTVATAAMTAEVADLVKGMGGKKLPGEHFVIGVGD